jgi:3-methyladenine DNA glycosylase AlkC
MEPLKEMFNLNFYRHFAAGFGAADKNFNEKDFIKDVTAKMDELSLNERLRNTSIILQRYLPASYPKAIGIMFKAAPSLQRGYTALVLPDFVGLFGKDHFALSMDALKYFTCFGSSEFAVREFLKADLSKTLRVMHQWADDKDHHVRRLASEGSRPRLPWSFKIDAIIKEPKLTTGILEKLNADPELYVRKSVANHLNDISKDNPGYMLGLVRTWDKTNPHTQWIIKHASRTLIKKGDSDSLALFNFEKNIKVRLEKFKLSSPVIRLGKEMEFGFLLASDRNKPQKLVIDYVIHYYRPSGELSKKVFKLKELELQAGQKVLVSKRQVFKDFTTRKHYAGKHFIEIMINGKMMKKAAFRLEK